MAECLTGDTAPIGPVCFTLIHSPNTFRRDGRRAPGSSRMPSLDLSSNSCAAFKRPTHRDGHDACKAEHMNPSNSSPRRTVCIQRLSVWTVGWLSFLGSHISCPGRQVTKKAFAGVHSEAVSVVVDKASSPAQLISGDRHDWETFCRVSASIEPKAVLEQRSQRLEDGQDNMACGRVFSCARCSGCWQGCQNNSDLDDQRTRGRRSDSRRWPHSRTID